MVRAEVLSLPSPTGQWTSEQLDLQYLMGKTHKLFCFMYNFVVNIKTKQILILTDSFQGAHIRKRKLSERICCNVLICQSWWSQTWATGATGTSGAERAMMTQANPKATVCSQEEIAMMHADGVAAIWFRCLVKTTYGFPPQYTWNEMTFFSRWEPGRCVVLCIDTPSGFPGDLLRNLERGQSPNLQDPFAFLMPLLDEIVLFYDRSVWSIRDLIRRVETEREEHHARDTDFSQLHEISRHATHSTETLSVTSDSMEAMLQKYLEFNQGLSNGNTGWRSTQQHISLQSQLIRNLKLRSQANQERLQSEITLVKCPLPQTSRTRNNSGQAYNRIAQRDSKVMLDISAATKSDSKAMKTVALVTMVFLPATFTSAVFSMSFFNFSPETGNWTVSREFWVYWVVAIPLTGLTLLFWLFFLQEPGARPALTLAKILEWRRKKSLNFWKV